MQLKVSGAARDESRTLIRNARQLVTLQGPSGPRCGAAMNSIGVIPNGAVLIHNGAIEEIGPSRRIENLASARNAREIDAAGKIIMPPFVEPDGALVGSWIEGKDDAAVLKVSSRRSLEFRASLSAQERVRYGCLAIGSPTPSSEDLRSVVRLLRAQRLLQQRPLRIRSIISWNGGLDGDFTGKWLPLVRRQKLASIVDLQIEKRDDAGHTAAMRDAATAASSAGFGVRIRSETCLEPATLLIALSAGVVSIVSPIKTFHAFTRPLASIGCVRVAPLAATAAGPEPDPSVRDNIDAGAAVALTSRRGPGVPVSINPQFLMHVAVERYGLTAAEALTGLTWNAACSLRMSHVTGSLDCGRAADLMILDAPDYRDLASRPGSTDVSLLMRGGRVVWQRVPLIPD